MKKKKPTIREVQAMVGRLLVQNQTLNQRISNTEFILDNYINWKSDVSKFKKFLEKEHAKEEDKSKELESKDGAGTRVHNK